jgi:hypothetical protein
MSRTKKNKRLVLSGSDGVARNEVRPRDEQDAVTKLV